ncbi:aspartic proteinase nepenthesin-2, partial [Phtheirospermum japonicum]
FFGFDSTIGLLLSESLIFPEKSVDNLVVGCSVFSTRLPSGIVGFGRGPESLPSQLGLKRFSYCLVSHKFDNNTSASSDLILSAAASKGGATKYTLFRKNPTSSNPAFQDYYYVTLRKITVGNGGSIVDSGTTFTFLEKQVFELVAREFEKQVGSNYNRALEVENQSGLRPCFNISGENLISLPQLTFYFKGGSKIILPLADYFSFLDDSAICMTIVTNNGTGGEVGPGSAIILGNYQQQNFYM